MSSLRRSTASSAPAARVAAPRPRDARSSPGCRRALPTSTVPISGAARCSARALGPREKQDPEKVLEEERQRAGAEDPLQKREAYLVRLVQRRQRQRELAVGLSLRARSLDQRDDVSDVCRDLQVARKENANAECAGEHE